MVGIVLVSHSRALANALLDLTRQVASPDVPIAIAAGVGDERAEFGTDAVEIHEAVKSVYSSDGVLVLMDLGSAILSTEMALELLPEEMQPNICLCSAPLVEGVISAAVQAGLGSSLETVYNEARQALLSKQEQLGNSSLQPADAGAPIIELPPSGREITITLHTKHGLHARPAAQFVQTAGRFDAHITVRNQTTGKGPVSAKSLNALATLGALYEHEITVMATGPQADAALDALRDLVAKNFGEHDLPSIQEQSAPVREPQPIMNAAMLEGGAIPVTAISEGIALGPLAHLTSPPPSVPDNPVDSPPEAWARLEKALVQVQQEIRARRRVVAVQAGEEQAAIFDAHVLILSDPDLLTQVKARIFSGGKNEAQAWHETIQETQAAYLALDDPYLRQRGADVSDVGEQVLRALVGENTSLPVFTHPVILVSEELTPTQTAGLDVEHVLGLMTGQGGPTSHSAILARSLGIPAVSNIPPSILTASAGTLVGLDGGSGALWVMPSQTVQADLETRREKWLRQRDDWQHASQQPAVTTDGRQIEIVANVGNLADAQAAVRNGAEGIGLLRTEFLFIARTTAPDEEEQFKALKEIVETMGDRPVIVRTMDVGGDKPIAYIPLPAEANPFLGVRGLRLSLQHPDLFATQLRAILRAGVGHPVRVMFPMVTNLDEVLRARQILADAHTALDAEEAPHAWPVETGIMIEVPSAALLAPVLAPHVDFFSVGTNDLTQYTLAAERGNPNLPGFADALHPAVLGLISQVVEAAEAQGKWVGVCGELAGDPVAAPVLVGLGVKELSLNPAGIPRIKSVVRNITFVAAKTFAEKALSIENTASMRELAEEFLRE